MEDPKNKLSDKEYKIMEEMEKALPRSQHARIANMMSRQLREGEITLKEYFIKCAYWGMKTLDDVYFMSLPTKPPKVIEFEQIPYSNRQKLGWEFFSDYPGIMEYYEKREWVETRNKTRLINLKEIKKYLPESEIDGHKKLDEKITDFKMKTEGV